MPVHKETDHLGSILPALHSPCCPVCVRLMCRRLWPCGRFTLFIDSRACLLPQHNVICEELYVSCTEEGCLSPKWKKVTVHTPKLFQFHFYKLVILLCIIFMDFHLIFTLILSVFWAPVLAMSIFLTFLNFLDSNLKFKLLTVRMEHVSLGFTINPNCSQTCVLPWMVLMWSSSNRMFRLH